MISAPIADIPWLEGIGLWRSSWDICGACSYSQDASKASTRRLPTFQANTLRGPTTCCQSAQLWLPMIMGQSGGVAWILRGWLQEAWTLTVTRCPMLPPTSFGVALMFTGVQEPPGTEVHGPGSTGVLLREENHLGRVQPVTGIQLAPLQQDEAAPCRGRDRRCACVCIQHPPPTARHTYTCTTEDRVRDALQISPNPRSLPLLILAHSESQSKESADRRSATSWTSCHIIPCRLAPSHLY